MNWKILFEQKILNRGYSYFHDSAVEDFDVNKGTITATVNGTEMYDVEINIGQDQIEDMYCSCPYAEGGKSCKHMAAVLYKWDFIRANTKEDAAAAVEQADEAEVRRFLADVLSNDQEMLDKFKKHSQSTAAIEVEDKRDYVVPECEEHIEQDHRQLDYYSKFYPHKVIAIKELRLDTGMGLDEAKSAIDELFNELDAKNEKPTGYTYVASDEYIIKNNPKQKKKLGCGESVRLFHLRFWIFITGLLVFEAAIGIFHPEISMGEAIIMVLITVPVFILLLKRHKYLEQYFDSAEYELKKEEKRRIKAQQQQQKYVEQQRRANVHIASSYSKPVSKQQDNGGSGCCLVVLFLVIFYAPIKLIAELTKKHY